MTHSTQNLHDTIGSIEIVNGVYHRGILDLPPKLLIKILSSIPVKERVRASRTCKTFHDVLSGPPAFSDVTRLPMWPELSYEQFAKILNSKKDTNTRSAMAKRLRSSVTSLSLEVNQNVSSNEDELLMFVSEFQMLTELRIDLGSRGFLFSPYVPVLVQPHSDTDSDSDTDSLQRQWLPTFAMGTCSKNENINNEFNLNLFMNIFTDECIQPHNPHLLQVSKLSLHFASFRNPASLTQVLKRLRCVVDFSAVKHLELSEFSFNESNFDNLQAFHLNQPGNCKSDVLGEFRMKNVETFLETINQERVEPQHDLSLVLSALCQLNLQQLQLFASTRPVPNDRWLTELAANSGETLEYLAFQPATVHALDFIQQERFKKLTCLGLFHKDKPQSLTSVISFIKGRPAGLPKLRLICDVQRHGNETEEQANWLRYLLGLENREFDFQWLRLRF